MKKSFTSLLLKTALSFCCFLLVSISTQAQYCSAGPSSTGDSNVQSVSMNGETTNISLPNACADGATTGVEDLTALVADVIGGNTYALDIQFGTCGGNYGGAGEAWIDYNQNGVFDASESVGQSSGTPGSTPWDVAVSFSVTIPATAFNGTTVLRIMQRESGSTPLDPCGSYTWGSVMDFSISISGATTGCIAPNTLAAIVASTTSADLSWVDGNMPAATAWNIELVTAGTAATGTPTQTGVTNPYTSTGLTAETDYEYYVQADCGGGTSSWSGPYAFQTPCDVLALPWTGTLENGGALPNCWMQNSDDDFDWVFGTSTPSSGTGPQSGDHTSGSGYFAYIETSSGIAGTTATLVSPTIDVSSLTTPFLSFYYDMFGAQIGTLNVEASADGATWTQVFTLSGDQGSGWNEGTGNLSAYTSTVQLRFTAVHAGTFAGDISIDDITIIEAPACAIPSAAVVSNILANSADITWTENGTATAWEVVVQAAGTGVPAGAGTTTTTNSYSATGLSSGTDYEVYVRSNCMANGISDWGGPVNFITPPGCGDSFFDTGGAGASYSNNEDMTWTFCPDNAGDVVTVNFTAFATENNYDGIYIYDGMDNTAPQMSSTSTGGSGSGVSAPGVYMGTDSPGQVVATGTSGCLTFNFVSDGSATQAGWEATVSCGPAPVYPANDDCAGGMNLNAGGVAGAPTAGVVSSTTLGATGSDVLVGTCGGNPDDDVWFNCETDANGGDFTITISNTTISPTIEVFTVCPDNATQATFCISGSNSLVVTGAAASTVYYIRVFDSGNGNGFTGGDLAERAAGGFDIAVAGSALPVELSSFTATAKDKMNYIEWTTSAEINTSRHIIERSLNGATAWTEIGAVAAAGNSFDAVQYNMEDMNPTSVSYYRLRTIDLDGSESLSQVVVVKRTADFDIVAISPNPTSDNINVSFDTKNAGEVEATVTDMTGRVLEIRTTAAAEGTNTMNIDLATYPNGIYFLSLNNGVNNVTRRVVKQ